MEREERFYQPLTEPSLSWQPSKGDDNKGTLVVQPFEPGLGITIGNALRRIILSFIEGSAVTAVIIEGANHEFAVLEGVVEDVMQVILNIKSLVIKNETGMPGTMRLSKKQSGEVFASDIETDEHLQIVNKDLKIATLSKDGSLNIQMFVEVGRGYSFAQWPSDVKFQEDGKIYIDSLFSPILNVAYTVEKTRVGQSLDYDKLILEVKTNGAVTPKFAVDYAASVLRANCKFLLSEKDLNFAINSTARQELSDSEEEPENTASGVSVDLFTKPIQELELSVRAQNCLDSADIRTVLDLVNLTDEETLKIKNFGRKTLKEVKEVLAGLGLRLGMNIKLHDLKRARKENAAINVNKFG